ncbi:hypothetical protein BREVUG8_110903 [Brevundimonas sp. G8]|nr:hypothetical protein BREVUG8_110903 [Brevundimonas sp. G8]
MEVSEHVFRIAVTQSGQFIGSEHGLIRVELDHGCGEGIERKLSFVRFHKAPSAMEGLVSTLN